MIFFIEDNFYIFDSHKQLAGRLNSVLIAEKGSK